MQLIVPPLFGIAVIEVVLYSMLMLWMGFKVGMARKKYGVKYPAAYEVKDDSVFNRYQRAHQNAVESAPQFFASLLLSALFSPLPAVVAGAFYIVGRYIYCVQYYKDVKKRVQGSPFFFFAQFYLWGSCIAFGVQILNSA